MYLPEIKYRLKGGLGIASSDLLVINKIDLISYVGASLVFLSVIALTSNTNPNKL
jgi:Ni2+-binding GTPase involved in maturation of urease and hydrogenase